MVGGFRAPPCPYCPGHRTVDFGPIPSGASGVVVRSPVTGRVVFAGEVAGIGYVTVEPSDAPGFAVTVGGLARFEVATSDGVGRGAPLGRATAPGPVTLSLRRVRVGGEAEYLDPGPRLGRRPARLVPVDGTASRPGRGDLVCRAGRRSR